MAAIANWQTRTKKYSKTKDQFQLLQEHFLNTAWMTPDQCLFIEEEEDRREGKGRRCCLGDILECHTIAIYIIQARMI